MRNLLVKDRRSDLQTKISNLLACFRWDLITYVAEMGNLFIFVSWIFYEQNSSYNLSLFERASVETFE